MGLTFLGKSKRESLRQIDNSFSQLYEDKQNKIFYSDTEPQTSEDGDMWIDITKKK